MSLKNAISFLLIVFLSYPLLAQNGLPEKYTITWKEQSKNSSESMPCGGGDIGLNVWVENGDLLFYFSRSGTFDENNEFLKLGRVRVRLQPNPFEGKSFSQQLVLNDGYVKIEGGNTKLSTEINVWVDVFHPTIYLDINSSESINAEVFYENWRFEDMLLKKYESFANSYKWAAPVGLKKHKDSIVFNNNRILFYHRNKSETIFDVCVKQQGMDKVKEQLFNPLQNLTFGGLIWGKNMSAADTIRGKYLDTEFKAWSIKSNAPSKIHEVAISLFTAQFENIEEWITELESQSIKALTQKKTAAKNSKLWWNKYWDRSFIVIEPENENTDENLESWQIGRNYQLFRYMLGCNAFGSYPTKFNGGLFTYDPCFTNSNRCFTPDYRNWGGGTFTAQNQRLVYFPMLKSGDFELMKPQFDFYLRILKTAELRSEIYWGHGGACYAEQIENFGLPNPSEYGWKRPENYDKGMQYNAWLEYQWDTSLEICLMILEQYYYAGIDISEYIDFITSCIDFFDIHYKYLAKQRGRKSLDENGHLILYPGSSCETYKMAYNATSTIAGLTTVVEKLLALPLYYVDTNTRKNLLEILTRIPDIEYRTFDGKTTIAPAKLWERVNNTEAPQLYPVFPYGMFGIGKPGLDTAINTYTHDPDLLKFRSHVGWKQDNIFAARLGLTDEAWKYTSLKLKDSKNRFPAFWGPGFDWTPDHNWGGSGMIGLQDMLLQTVGDTIYLLPAWPKEIDVHFKLHAPGNTIIEAKITKGNATILNVTPEERRKEIVLIEMK